MEVGIRRATMDRKSAYTRRSLSPYFVLAKKYTLSQLVVRLDKSVKGKLVLLRLGYS